jgi:hypothetical protein
MTNRFVIRASRIRDCDDNELWVASNVSLTPYVPDAMQEQ